MIDVTINNENHHLVQVFFDRISYEYLDTETWNKLSNVDAKDDKTLVEVFKEHVQFARIPSDTQNRLKAALSEVLTDEKYDLKTIFDEFTFPFENDVNERHDYRRWLLLMWEACFNK